MTPSLRAELEAAAEQVGAPTFNRFLNELLSGRAAATVAGTRRNPEAVKVVRALDDAARENNALGNNLNQLMRHLHSTGGDPRDMDEVRAVLALIGKAADLYILALDRVMAL